MLAALCAPKPWFLCSLDNVAVGIGKQPTPSSLEARTDQRFANRAEKPKVGIREKKVDKGTASRSLVVLFHYKLVAAQ